MYHLLAAHRQPHRCSNLFARVLLQIPDDLVWSGACLFSPQVMYSPPMFYCRTIQLIPTARTKRWRPSNSPHPLHIRSPEALPAPLTSLAFLPIPMERAMLPRTDAMNVHWGLHDCAVQDEADVLERAVSWRRWIHRYNPYVRVCKEVDYMRHISAECIVSTSPRTNIRVTAVPNSPAQFVASQDLIGRMSVFLRGELLVCPNAEVEFLVTFVIPS
ncbi:hypothetical protein BJY52DRAFT_429792 [Lactarius psammicola]|nr:hypothetical protein BJY52DRAFT_429792 [Lactarius psammicola]